MIFKSLLNIRRDNKKILTISTIDIVLKVATILLWILFISYLLLILTSLIWKLFSVFWFEELYVPNSIRFILNIFLGLIIWIILVSIGFFIIYKYSNFKNEKNKNIDPQIFNHYNNSFLWKELIYFDSDHKDNYMLNQKLLLNEELYNFSPFKMLSYGVILYNKKMIKESISVIRLVIDHPDSTRLLVKIAEYKLLQILPYSGNVGIKIMEKIEEGSLTNENS